MIYLEHLQPGDWDTARRNFERLMQGIDTGGVSIGLRFGVAALTWPGGTQFSNETTVTHGLGRTPIGVIATANLAALAGVAVWTETPGPATFVLQGWNPAGSPGAGAIDAAFWVAIG